MSLRTYHVIESSNWRVLNAVICSLILIICTTDQKNWCELVPTPQIVPWPSSMILLSLLLYLISDSSVPTEIIAISSGTFSKFERVPVSSTSISTTSRRPEGDASDKLISIIVPSKLTSRFRSTRPRRRPAFGYRFRHVLEVFLMTLIKTFFVAVQLPEVSWLLQRVVRGQSTK